MTKDYRLLFRSRTTDLSRPVKNQTPKHQHPLDKDKLYKGNQ